MLADSVTSHQIFPALAGVFLKFSYKYFFFSYLPRASGGVPHYYHENPI